MNVIKNQKGITTTTVIGFVLILAIVGFTGWRVLEANKAINGNKVVSNQPVQSDNEKEPTKPTVPDGYVKYSKNKLTFYYPEEQQPAKDTTATQKKYVSSVVSAVELKDFNVTMYKAANLQLQMGIGAPWVCNYDVSDSTFTLNKAKSFTGISSSSCDKFNEKDEFNSIAFNNLSTGYEARIIKAYAAPTDDDMYLIKVSSTRDDGECYTGELTEAECEERADQQLEELQDFMAKFADVNESLFK